MAFRWRTGAEKQVGIPARPRAITCISGGSAGGLLQSSHLRCDTLLPSQQVASPPPGARALMDLQATPTSVPPTPALSSVCADTALSGGCMRAANPAPLSVGGYFAAPAERARAPWSQPPIQAAGLFMTVLPPHGQLAKEYSSSTHGGPTLGQQTGSAKLGNGKSTATYCHQHSSKEGRHRSKNRQGHNLTHTQTLWVGCPQVKGSHQDRNPEDHTGTNSRPSRDAGTVQTFNYPEAGQQSQVKKPAETLPPSVPPSPRASGGNGRDKGTRGLRGTSCRGGSWESWQPDVAGGQPLAQQRQTGSSGGGGGSVRRTKGEKECLKQETKNHQGHTPLLSLE